MIQTSRKTEAEIANDKAERIMNGVAAWCSFYRENIHRFARDYLNVTLKRFQAILLVMMDRSNYFMFLATRGIGKTWLVALYCFIRCILYPGTTICVASKTRPQANVLLEKIVNEIMANSDNAKLEVADYAVGQNKSYIEFKNGSMIKVVTANDNARSARANILVTDEFRMVSPDVLNKVLRKFLAAPRSPKYLEKEEYKHLEERNKEIYMSSCFFQSHWSYKKVQSYCAAMLDDKKKYFVCGLPYQLSIKEGLYSREQAQDEMSEADFSQMTWDMEMGCLWYGDKDGSLFTYDDATKDRVLKKCIYPDSVAKMLGDKELFVPDLEYGEQRILSADVALLASTKQNNDAASIWINRALLSKSQRLVGNFLFSDNREGMNTDELALLIRRYYEVFKCNQLVLDVKGIGLGVYDCLVKDMFDPETGETYGALNCCNDSVYSDRCKVRSAPKVIWAIQASQKFNQEMYLLLRDGIKQHRVNFLIHELDADENFREVRGYNSLSTNNKITLQMPYINTTLLINELINLEYEVRDNAIKVFEKSGMRKDRVSSVGYNYWVQQQLERQLSSPTGRGRSYSSILSMARKPSFLNGI